MRPWWFIAVGIFAIAFWQALGNAADGVQDAEPFVIPTGMLLVASLIAAFYPKRPGSPSVPRACGNCGGGLEVGQRFCSNCGERVDGPIASAAGVASPQQAPVAGRRNRRRQIVVACAAIALFVAGTTYSFLAYREPVPSAETYSLVGHWRTGELDLFYDAQGRWTSYYYSGSLAGTRGDGTYRVDAGFGQQNQRVTLCESGEGCNAIEVVFATSGQSFTVYTSSASGGEIDGPYYYVDARQTP